jgi:LppP/LprE lipoprotein
VPVPTSPQLPPVPPVLRAVAAAAGAGQRDPRSAQPRNPEPLAGNYNECAQLSTVIVKANTNADNATTRAVMFHLGKYIPQGVLDTFGFNGIDASQTTGERLTVELAVHLPDVTLERIAWNLITAALPEGAGVGAPVSPRARHHCGAYGRGDLTRFAARRECSAGCARTRRCGIG